MGPSIEPCGVPASIFQRLAAAPGVFQEFVHLGGMVFKNSPRKLSSLNRYSINAAQFSRPMIVCKVLTKDYILKDFCKGHRK